MSVCTSCGRDNDAGAQFCEDCGKPLTRIAAYQRAASAAAAPTRSATSAVPRPTVADPIPATRTTCPHCGAEVGDTAARRIGDFRFTLVQMDEKGDDVRRFPCDGSETTIGREGGDVRFADDPFLSPLHARLSWEDGVLLVRDLGSRNGTWAFCEGPHRLVDGDFLLIGSQMLRYRRLGYPGPHTPDADSTQRTGSLVPRADIASLTQVRADGSPRDAIHLSPGRDVYVGRERGDWIFPYDQTMSAQHAVIRSEDADFVVLDQNSRNGIAIAVRGAVHLGHGSRILVGDKVLRVELPV